MALRNDLLLSEDKSKPPFSSSWISLKHSTLSTIALPPEGDSRRWKNRLQVIDVRLPCLMQTERCSNWWGWSKNQHRTGRNYLREKPNTLHLAWAAKYWEVRGGFSPTRSQSICRTPLRKQVHMNIWSIIYSNICTYPSWCLLLVYSSEAKT